MMQFYPEDNEIKGKIREYCMNTYIRRWSDFDVNDTDDSLYNLHDSSCV